MSIFTRMLRQRAVYWAPGPIGLDGQRTYSAPVVLKCRWTRHGVVWREKAGDVQETKTQVYVEADVEELGVLMFVEQDSTYDDDEVLDLLVSKTDPFANKEASEIRKFNKLPNLRARRFLREAIL